MYFEKVATSLIYGDQLEGENEETGAAAEVISL